MRLFHALRFTPKHPIHVQASVSRPGIRFTDASKPFSHATSRLRLQHSASASPALCKEAPPPCAPPARPLRCPRRSRGRCGRDACAARARARAHRASVSIRANGFASVDRSVDRSVYRSVGVKQGINTRPCCLPQPRCNEKLRVKVSKQFQHQKTSLSKGAKHRNTNTNLV